MDNTPTLIPIASGKGGVGKSFLAANIGIALARRGHRTIVVDLDLGGSLLYLFLGLRNRSPGIGDFLKTGARDLGDLLVPTETAGLKFLPGDGKIPFLANMTHVQKEKLLSRIPMLPADFILMDLGTGTAYHTLDFFNTTPLGLVVTTPDPASIMRLLGFLKSVLLRRIDRMAARNLPVRRILDAWYHTPTDEQSPAVETLLDRIAQTDANLGNALSKTLTRVRPRVVLNFGGHPEELDLAKRISGNLREKLSIEPDYFGFIYRDDTVMAAVKNRTPYLLYAGGSPTAANIARLAERIGKYYDRTVNDSAERLRRQAWEDYRDRSQPE